MYQTDTQPNILFIVLYRNIHYVLVKELYMIPAAKPLISYTILYG